jgi:hypothetical protein
VSGGGEAKGAAEQAEKEVERLREALKEAADFIWQLYAHISHGGPTRGQARVLHERLTAALERQR